MFNLQEASEREFATPAEIMATQQQLVCEHVRYLREISPYYRSVLSVLSDTALSHLTLAQLSALPLTSKQDIEANPSAFWCCPESDIIDICQTSGTTGTPVTIPLTAHDLERLAFNEALTFQRLNISANDRVLVAVAIERCFMAGLAYYLGAQKIGATALRGGSSNTGHLVQLVKQYRPDYIIGVPSLIAELGKRLLAENINPASLNIKGFICIGEPVRASDLSLLPLASRLSELWNAPVFGTYASTEMATAFTDCLHGCGGHINTELIAVEILNEQGEPLPSGVPGEVVVTPLQVRGMPLLRYQTGDIAYIIDEPCPCGRTSPRLSPVLGRKSQRMKVKGTSVYPSAVLALLQSLAGIENFCLEVYEESQLSDRLCVLYSTMRDDLTPQQVAQHLSAALRFTPEVCRVPCAELEQKMHPPGKRKKITFFDYRTTKEKEHQP
ncbi:phenylacetate--CoA ligase family protein [Chrysiogenes arsenatis]|uniref:phenylacetate--CoA ligase family protein n=1 Tax=Chrysiogenes arsenatis TaxID=309797 RepID=UPI0003F91E06|nr:AMP-binding protein [Chrysiogenes arsenatis]